MLIELHILQNHAPSNLNRDDTGSPKECVFGGVKRARISSQCLKRSIRRSDVFQSELVGKLATRTRRLPELVRQRLIDTGGAEDMAAVAAVKASGFGTKDGKERGKEGDKELDTAQTMFLTEADIAAVTGVLAAAAAEDKTVAKFKDRKASELQAAATLAGYRPTTVDIALFGRMTTSDAFRDVEASTQVAHAVSTHQVSHEFDYFTAVDDLQGQSENEEDAGADMIGDVEYNSSCYYKYFSIDTRGLCRNLTGEAVKRAPTGADKAEAVETARTAIEALIRAAVTITPTGKQNSFAAHQLPAVVLVEVRPTRTPVSYANAFVDPARPGGKGLVDKSMEKLSDHVAKLTKAFNLELTVRVVLVPEPGDVEFSGFTVADSLNDLCAAVREVVRYE